MSNVVYVTILSIVLAVGWGVAFSTIYPAIPIDGQLAGLFALIGVGTSLLVFALCKAIFGSDKKKSTP